MREKSNKTYPYCHLSKEKTSSCKVVNFILLCLLKSGWLRGACKIYQSNSIHGNLTFRSKTRKSKVSDPRKMTGNTVA